MNVAERLREVAEARPDQVAIAVAAGRYTVNQPREYRSISFRELQQRTSSIAAGLQQMGVSPGMRIVLLVRFGADFIALVFGLLKAGAVVVLVDPGMGRRNLIDCLAETNPQGFVAIELAQLARMILYRKFPQAKYNVTVGHRWGILPAPTLASLSRVSPDLYRPPKIDDDDPAAIIFTTGSTGPPKGVLYTHRTFNNQIDQLIEHYSIIPGGKDLSGFPLFGLFNAVMGTTTIVPDMDPTRPADVDPPRLLDAIDQWQVNQAFGSPALWSAVGRYCEQSGRKIPSLKRVLSAGAPVSPRVLRSLRESIDEKGEVFTPYGATEALPVASIESREVLLETAAKTACGAGTCVGRRFSGIDWRVIEIDDGPLASIDLCKVLACGQIGELMVSGNVVTRTYLTRTDQNAYHKVIDGDRVWHRMGDVGYLDQLDRFWYCGRKSHRVQTTWGPMFTDPCEAIFNSVPEVYRSALVGLGHPGSQIPVMIVEPWPDHRPKASAEERVLVQRLQTHARQSPLTEPIERILIYPGRLPTDIRHNAKIFREQLVPWAKTKVES